MWQRPVFEPQFQKWISAKLEQMKKSGNSLYNNGLQNFTLSATDPQMDSGSGEYLALSKSWLPKSSRE